MSDRSRDMTREDLVQWGEQLGRDLKKAPTIVTLSGDLGAGKTTLTQAICRGYGVRDEVTSPTFALVHVYDAQTVPVYHVDLYRLNGPRDLQNIGWDDIMEPEGLVIVEWPERAANAFPNGALAVDLQFVPGEPDKRRVTVRAADGAVA